MTNSRHTCAICLEDLVIPSPNMCMTECSHIFHLNCLLRSREHNRTCPLCRADIPNDQQHNIDNDVIEVNDNIIEEADLIENIENVLLEIVNGSQLNTSITEIVNNASNNNISNMEVQERLRFIERIHNLCNDFCNSTFNYLTHFRHLYNIDYIDYYTQVNLYNYSILYNMNEQITQIVERAAANNIRNNMTFDRMENDIYDVCLDYCHYIITSVHT
jgi:hypothetical protein